MLFSKLDEIGPILSDHVNLVLVLLLNLVLVHLEDAELLDNLCNLELYIHRVLADLVDHIQEVLDRVNGRNIALELLLVGVCLSDDGREVPDSNVLEDLAEGVEPELNLLVGTIDNLLVVDEDEIVLNLRLLLLDVHTLKHLEADNHCLNILHAT